MIYISTSCIKEKNIIDVLKILVKNNIKNIELSGGTKYFQGLEDQLIRFVDKEKINVRVHNYFPPPEKDFVVNIASLNSEIYDKSINHCIKAIKLAKKLGSDKYSVHAGFLIDPGVKEIGFGNKLEKKKLYDNQLATNKFITSYNILKNEGGKKFKIYIENNVLSKSNYEKYHNNPFLLTTKNDYENLRKKFKFDLLLDVAHLKVSANSLNKDFDKELKYLYNQTDYVHLSGNDALEDSNKSLMNDNIITKFLKNNSLKNKTFTLEVYEEIDKIVKDYNFLKDL